MWAGRVSSSSFESVQCAPRRGWACTSTSIQVRSGRLPSFLVPLFRSHMPILKGIACLFFKDWFLHIWTHLKVLINLMVVSDHHPLWELFFFFLSLLTLEPLELAVFSSHWSCSIHWKKRQVFSRFEVPELQGHTVEESCSCRGIRPQTCKSSIPQVKLKVKTNKLFLQGPISVRF